jgi:hypothetical protein
MTGTAQQDGAAPGVAPRDEDREPTPWRWLMLLTALAVVLRAIGLDGGLWFDEIATLLYSVRLPFADIVTEFPSNNQHTFFSVLARLSILAFGEHAWSLRLPALLFGAATVPVLYVFARRYAGRVESLLACLLLTTSYHHVWFSQNARGYSMLACLTLLGSWLLLRTMERGRTIDAVWYGLAAALGVYTHLTMVFLVIAHALLCAATMTTDPSSWRRWRPAAVAFLLAGLFTLLLYSPVLLDLKQFFVDEAKPAAVATPAWAVLELIKGLRIGLGTGIGALAAAALFAAGLWSYYRQNRFVAGVFLLPAALTVAAAVGLGRPIFPRFLFFSIGFGVLIVVRGSIEMGRWIGRTRALTAGSAVVLAMAVVSAVSLVPNYRLPKQDFDGALRFVEAQRTAGEPVVTAGVTGDIYRDYYRRPWPAVASGDELDRIRALGRRVWVLYTLESYIENDSPDLMRALRTHCREAAVFRGTVGSGDVTACAVPPLPVGTPEPRR